MCSECLHNPCHPRCPNADDPKFDECKECGLLIYDDGYYEDSDGNKFCSAECALEFHSIEYRSYDDDYEDFYDNEWYERDN